MERRSEDLSARQPVGDRQTGTVPAGSCPISFRIQKCLLRIRIRGSDIWKYRSRPWFSPCRVSVLQIADKKFESC